ncbi:MAG: 16S rRNA (uracil(1498)-N(3))-methyltransferase [Actinomycetota bacterium]|nr:16S rRNA (uracil(1498)-N(3))-methyltransferase [Actinomycetota bacterium]
MLRRQQVAWPGNVLMDDALRRSAGHVLVGDLAAPAPSPVAMHHLLRVLRLRDGESVTVTDGAGGWRPCVVAGTGLEPTGGVRSVPRTTPELTIAVAPPKGDRLEWLVTKCTEVGIDRIVLLDAERSVVRWKGDRAVKQLDRLGKLVVEASMQSRRVWLPKVEGPVSSVDVLKSAVASEPGGRSMTSSDVTVAVGPEGGWTPAELASASGTVSLGDTVLRVETAAVAAAVLMVSHR